MQTVATGVRVTYLGADSFVGRFDGDDYEFAKDGEPLIMSHHAAAHIFGYGQDREGKIKSFARNGWMNSTDQYNQALTRLKDFQFDEVAATFTESLSQSTDDGRTPVNEGGGNGGVEPPELHDDDII